MRLKPPSVYPLEAEEGKAFVAWLRLKKYHFQHSPNETGSSPEAKRRATRMKAQGTSPGFPDYIILKDGHVIAIELKRVKGSTVSNEQREWLGWLAKCGVYCFIARGAAEAIEAVESVGERTEPADNGSPF